VKWFLDQTAGIDGNNPILFPTRSEYAPDELTLRFLAIAEELFEKEGDRSGYSLIFSVPKNKHLPNGGYMQANVPMKVAETV
jgi:hypothetical protein